MPQNSALTEAATWTQSLLLGSFGTAIAILGVAMLGYSMLTGKASLRLGGRIVIGAFVLFSAPLVARGLASLAQEGNGDAQVMIASPPPPAPQPVEIPPLTDPHTGAAVPGYFR